MELAFRQLEQLIKKIDDFSSAKPGSLEADPGPGVAAC